MQPNAIVSFGGLNTLANWSEQEVAIHEMRKIVAPNGIIVLIEGFQEGLDNLNAVRGSLELPELVTDLELIPQPNFAQLMMNNGGTMRQEYADNIGNFYCMVRDVMQIDDSVNLGMAAKLPSFGEFYACSPFFMVVIRVA